MESSDQHLQIGGHSHPHHQHCTVAESERRGYLQESMGSWGGWKDLARDLGKAEQLGRNVREEQANVTSAILDTTQPERGFLRCNQNILSTPRRYLASKV